MRLGLVASSTALALAAALAGCSQEPDVPDPGPAAEELASALAAGDLSSLTGQPDAQDQYDAALDDAMADLPRTVEVVRTRVAESAGEESPSVATATLRWTWDLSERGGDPWSYTTSAALARDGSGWSPRWDRGEIHPDLREGDTLDLSTLEPDRGDIVGANGAVLVTERPVTRFGIARDLVARKQAVRSARRLARLLGVDPGDYAARVRAAGPKAFVEALVLRRSEIPVEVGRDYPSIPGALAVKDALPLAATKDFARPILGSVGEVTAEMIEEDPSLRAGDVRGLSGLQARYDDQLAGTPGLAISRVAADGNSTIVERQPATDGEDLRITLDRRLQRRAEQLLAPVGPASALVAVRPSDGALLVAANGPGTDGGNLATYGRSAPGSTFKVVSTLALLRSGATASTVVDCPASTVVDGKRFENYDDYPAAMLGRIQLGAAVASSCNTAFVNAASRVGHPRLAAAAASLGLGVDHEVGFPAYFGQVPAPEGETEAAADMIGQGGVLASPMAMAAVAGSVQAGSTVVPYLVDDVRSEAGDDVQPLTRAEGRQLRSMLRRVVRSGSGSQLADVPGPPVLAKTGTAEFDRDGKRLLHAWMVAAQGDLAVAVLVDVGASGSGTAGPLLEPFLRSARNG